MAKSPGEVPRLLTLWPLVAATYFMVSGGPFGTEDIVHGAGYFGAVLVVFLTPIFWSLPVAFMVGELSSAIPAEGGFYVWVRRTLGPFWGFQEAWLSLAASAFDMAIYPTLFVTYVSEVVPRLQIGHNGILLGLLMIAACAIWNIAGAKAVGESSFWMMFLLLAPFAWLCFWVIAHPAHVVGTGVHLTHKDWIAGVLVAMWNYMGWDNASTIAEEVDQPQRTYPLAMVLTVLIVALTYSVPFAIMSRSGIAPSAWQTGSWAEFGGTIVGPWLKIAIVLGGALSSFGMFNSLVMSYSRLPLVMAEDGYLPHVFTKIHPRTGAPWVSILFCAAGWALCLGIEFERLVTLDILLYGSSLLLEFAALIALRVRAPELSSKQAKTEAPGIPRPFRVPGGRWGAWIVWIGPAALMTLAIQQSRGEQIAGISAFAFGIIVMAAGVLAYFAARLLNGKRIVAIESKGSVPG